MEDSIFRLRRRRKECEINYTMFMISDRTCMGARFKIYKNTALNKQLARGVEAEADCKGTLNQMELK